MRLTSMTTMAGRVLSFVLAATSAAHGAEFNVALLQMKPDADHIEANAAKAREFCRRARDTGGRRGAHAGDVEHWIHPS